MDVEPDLAVEQIAGKSRRDDPGAVVELAGTGLGARDQLLHRLRAVLGANAQERRVLGCERDRGEVLERIIRQVAGGDRIEHHGDVHRREQGVAVGRQLGDARGGDCGVGARLIFDHHRLAPHLAQTLPDHASENVGRPAGRERHDDADCSVGIGLAVGGSLGGGDGDRGDESDRRKQRTEGGSEANDKTRYGQHGSAIRSIRSIVLHSGFLHDRGPALCFLADEG